MNIEYTKQIKSARADNFNRDSSAVKSRGGYVIHSGIHRSTAFVSRLDAVESLEYWQKNGGLNPWVEGTIEGLDLEDCELNAAARLHPKWKFSRIQSDKFSYCLAVRGTERIGGRDWRELNEKI